MLNIIIFNRTLNSHEMFVLSSKNKGLGAHIQDLYYIQTSVLLVFGRFDSHTIERFQYKNQSNDKEGDTQA